MVPLLEIYCVIDDFCKKFEVSGTPYLLPTPHRKRQRKCALSTSEIMTIIVLFHLSHYRTFKDFYLSCLCTHLKNEFPNLVSYNRFLELKPLAVMPLYIFLKSLMGHKTGKYYIDSTKLQVCDNLRIRSNKVFKDLAKRGKTSTGWFFGFKLHLITNDKGDIMNFKLTSGNIDDRAVVKKMTQGLKGWLFGDKGYIKQELADELEKGGLELITRSKKNMKKSDLNPLKKLWLNKRGIIESVIGQLKAIVHIQHTRHRSPNNFLVNVLGALLAYVFKPKKPTVSFSRSITRLPLLISS